MLKPALLFILVLVTTFNLSAAQQPYKRTLKLMGSRFDITVVALLFRCNNSSGLVVPKPILPFDATVSAYMDSIWNLIASPVWNLKKTEVVSVSGPKRFNVRLVYYGKFTWNCKICWLTPVLRVLIKPSPVVCPMDTLPSLLMRSLSVPPFVNAITSAFGLSI